MLINWYINVSSGYKYLCTINYLKLIYRLKLITYEIYIELN